MKVNFVFLLLGLFIAFFLEHIPVPDLLYWFRPQWIALFVIILVLLKPFTYTYWLVLPVGLLADVEHGSVLGLHCFMLTLYILIIHVIYRRFMLLQLLQQTLVIFVIVIVVQSVSYAIVGLFTHTPDVIAWIPALSSAFVWPWLSVMSFWLFRQQSIKAASS